MMNYRPKHGDMELWLICAATNGDNDKILEMVNEKDGTYPVKFEVGGVELLMSWLHQKHKNFWMINMKI